MTDVNIEIYKSLLNLEDAELSLIAHGDAIVAIVYKAITIDGRELIIKICDNPSHYFKELYFLKYFADKLPVPKIISTIEPSSDLHGAILMECVPGNILNKNDLTLELAYEIGSLLAKVHLNRTSAFGDLTDDNSMILDPITYFSEKFEESFDECKGHLPETILTKCWDFYQNNLPLLSSVDGPCIIHRDFRPGNIVALNAKVSGIIDWASGRSGFAEDDLCTLEIGEWGNDPHIKQAFIDGYSSIRAVPDYSKIINLLLLNRALAIVGFTVKIGTWDNRDLEFYNRNRNIIEEIIL